MKLRDILLPYISSKEESATLSPSSILAEDSFLSLSKKAQLIDDKPKGTLSGYEDRVPSFQNAIDLLEGWSSSFPQEYDLDAGKIPLFDDARLIWGLEQYGSLEGKRVLELGPLEGAHTFLLDQMQPSELVAVEANKSAYLRCLITKEICNMKHARFLLGDFVKYLEAVEQPFDFILASGVLYHMKDPLRLLKLIGAKSNAALIWTHYFDEKVMSEDDARRIPFSGKIIKTPFMDMEVNLYSRSYYNAWKENAFCGGPENDHCWIEKEQLLQVIKLLGFKDIRLWGDEPDHPNGPCCLFYVSK